LYVHASFVPGALLQGAAQQPVSAALHVAFHLPLYLSLASFVAPFEQVRYFKALPSNLSALRAAAARLAEEGELPDHEQMHVEAEEVLHDLTARGHKGRRRHGHAMVAAT
jgi:hypothetical protein